MFLNILQYNPSKWDLTIFVWSRKLNILISVNRDVSFKYYRYFYK